MFFLYHFSQVSLCKTMANVQRMFVFVLFWFGFASSMKRIVCIYNFVTVALFYIGVQLFPKLTIIKIVLILIYIKKVFFIRNRYNYIYIYMQIVIIIVFLRKSCITKGKGQNAQKQLTCFQMKTNRFVISVIIKMILITIAPIIIVTLMIMLMMAMMTKFTMIITKMTIK